MKLVSKRGAHTTPAPPESEAVVTDDSLFVHTWPANADAPTMMVLHDTGDHGGHWADVADHISPTWRVVAPDLHGRGRSRPHAGPHSTPDADLAAHLRDLTAVWHQYQGALTVWVGHGFGALLATELAALQPDLVAALVLIDPPDHRHFDAPPPSHGMTWLNRDSYILHARSSGEVPRTGLGRGARTALVNDLRGSGFLWRRHANASAVSADHAIRKAWQPHLVESVPTGVISTASDTVGAPAPWHDATRWTHVPLDHRRPLFATELPAALLAMLEQLTHPEANDTSGL